VLKTQLFKFGMHAPLSSIWTCK